MGRSIKIKSVAVLVCIFSVCLTTTQVQAGRDTNDNKSRVGRAIENFELKDFRGKNHKLTDYAQSKVIVIAFLGTECPLAKLYTVRLNELAAKYQEQGVQFLGIDANRQDSITEIAAYARQHNIKFPILKDAGNKVADQFLAVRTPEIFVLDAQRVVRYWGRIDDQYGVGYIRNEPTRNDLELAITELLAGHAVSVETTVAPGCHIGRVKDAQESSSITYSKQVSRILQKRCVECHREGQIAPFSLTDYDEVVGWAEMIAEVVEDQRMPPWHADPKFGHFTNDRALTAEEKQTIFDWVDAGAPQGDPAELPEPRKYVAGWQLPQKPDIVLNMRDKPFNVPAEGTVRYQYFKVDPGFTEDKWVKAFQVLPGNLAVVHHILVFAAQPGQRPEGGGGATGFLAGYVPGLTAIPFPDGMAKKIKAGSELIFQVHYTPIGTEQDDLSSIGMVLADPDEITHQVKTTSAVKPDFVIPPNAGNHKVEAQTSPSKYDVLLLGMMPHMHLRGKSFFYEAIYSDGKKETLMNIPAYDFNWQTGYRLTEPKPLPKGTSIHVIGHFDNSADNLNNPNPNETVSWGEQTWDEMLIGYFDVAFPVEEMKKGKPFDRNFRRGRRRGRPKPEEIFNRLDHNKDDKLEENEIPRNFRGFINRVDLNKDKIVTRKEFMDAMAAAKALENVKNSMEPKALLKRYDKNKDGKISKEETPRLLWPVVSRFDKDGDGFLTEDELKKLKR